MSAKIKRSRARKRPPQLSPQLAARLAIDDAILTIDEWRIVNDFSPRTAQRILHGANPPITTQLSTQRRGITVGNNRAWQQSRAS